MARKSLVTDGQYLLDLAEVRERLAALGAKLAHLDQLRADEVLARNALRDLRRRIKECQWDLRNLTYRVKRDVRAADTEETRPDGGAV